MRFAAFILAVGAAVVLTGCTDMISGAASPVTAPSSGSSAPEADAAGDTPEETPGPGRVPDDEVDAIFIAILDNSPYRFDRRGTDAELIGLAQRVCTFLTSDLGEPIDAALGLVSDGYPPDMAGYFVGVAIAGYCPEEVPPDA